MYKGNIMYIIYYTTKATVSNNTYYTISKEDELWMITKLIQIQSFMGEITLTKNHNVKEVINWYQQPLKELPVSTTFKKHNSPQSFVAGTLNNMLFNKQGNITDTQAKHLQYIINAFATLSPHCEVSLQKNGDTQEVEFKQDIWTYK